MNAQLGFPLDLNQINAHVARNVAENAVQAMRDSLKLTTKVMDEKYAHLQVQDSFEGKVIESLRLLPDEVLIRFVGGTYAKFQFYRDRHDDSSISSCQTAETLDVLRAWGLVSDEDWETLLQGQKRVADLESKDQARRNLERAIRELGVEEAERIIGKIAGPGVRVT